MKDNLEEIEQGWQIDRRRLGEGKRKVKGGNRDWRGGQEWSTR